MADPLDVRDLVLVVSADCHLCDEARALLSRLCLPFREVDLEDDEAGELAGRGVPVVFFPVLVDGEQVISYGDITEMELRRALPLEIVA
ncbi:MAG: glutaredoxin family protein [Thermoleophilia bacterium]|nr:glutaredoxin family protein [Thermoleophilia bacterium]